MSPARRPATAVSAPVGMRVVADAGLRRYHDGRVLVGGSPLRILRLTEAGARRVDGWLAGDAVCPAEADRGLLRRLLRTGMVHPVRGERAQPVAVTVVIPVRDDPQRLREALTAGGPDRPVVVVDDGSADGEAHRTVAEEGGARYLRRDVSGGPGAARNEGLMAVETEVVAFVDVDVTVDGDSIAALAAHLCDPAVAAVAPRVTSATDRAGVLPDYEALHSPLDLGSDPSPVGPGRRVSYVPAACLVARTDVVRAVGGFDSELRWGEDVDLVWRIVDQGHTIRYDPSIEAGHEPRPGWREWLDQRRRYGASAAPLARRHGRKVAPARCSPWSVAVWGAVAAGHPLIGVGVAAGSTAALARKLGHLPGGHRLAIRLAGLGHLHAGVGLARAAGRAWWPLTVGAALAHRRRCRTLLLALVAPPLIDWVRDDLGSADPLRTIALRLVDDLAYGAGVWEGMGREHSWAAIRPDLITWPNRGDTIGDGSDRPGPR